MKKSKSVRYALNKNKYLLEPEMQELERVLKSNEEEDFRNCTLLWLGLHTGARATELLNITKKDLNSFEQSIFIVGIKGSNDREIPIPAWLFKRIEQLITSENEKIFPISYARFSQIWDIYRPTTKKLHSLRHTFAINLYKRTKDLRLVQVALGHRNISNTMVYADYVYSQQELRRLIGV